MKTSSREYTLQTDRFTYGTKNSIDLFGRNNKRQEAIYNIFIPLNRLLYLVALPLLFSLIIQSLIVHPDDWVHPLQLLAIAVVVSTVALLTAYIGFKKLFLTEEKLRSELLHHSIDNLIGRIIEDGSHSALLTQKGIYASLWDRQSGGFLEE